MFRKDHLHGERIVSGSEPLPEQFPPDWWGGNEIRRLSIGRNLGSGILVYEETMNLSSVVSYFSRLCAFISRRPAIYLRHWQNARVTGSRNSLQLCVMPHEARSCHMNPVVAKESHVMATK
jgi:hypothetical protein